MVVLYYFEAQILKMALVLLYHILETQQSHHFPCEEATVEASAQRSCLDH